MDCITETRAIDLVHGRVDAAQAQAIREHAATCGRCRRTLAAADVARTRPDRQDDSSDSGGNVLHVPPRSASSENLPAGELPRGTVIGHYVLLDLIAHGGMGAVYEAFDRQLDRRVALKVVREHLAHGEQSEEWRKRLLREAKAMARLSHPNVTVVHEVGTWNDRVFLAMELVEGQTLGQWLKAQKRSEREIVEVFRQAGLGLAAAHAAGLVHLDFKPANVLVAADGRVVVTDFGIAVTLEHQAERERVARETGSPTDTSFAGTPAYMAPEQHRGTAVDARADQFSFCVALHEALSGQNPFAHALHTTLPRLLDEQYKPEPVAEAAVPKWVRGILARGLSTRPEDRYPSMQALLADLARDPYERRRKVMWSAAAAVAVLAAAAGVQQYLAYRASLCGGFAEEVGTAWSAERKKALIDAFAASGAPFAQDAATRIHTALDGWAEAWVTRTTEVCEATRLRNEQSEPEMVRRLECLEQRRAEVSALVDVFTSKPDKKMVALSEDAMRGIIPLSRCDALTVPAGIAAAPTEPAKVAQIREARVRLAQSRALQESGQVPQALQTARDALPIALEVGWPPIEAEVHQRIGDLQERLAHSSDAEQSFLRAVWAAEAGRHDEIAAEAWINLLSLAAYRMGNVEKARLYEGHARAAVTRLGGDLAAEASLEHALALSEMQVGDPKQALAHAERAIELRTKIHGAEHPRVITTRMVAASALNLLDRMDEAIAIQRQVLEYRERTAGADHPNAAMANNNLGFALIQKGHFDEARTYLERAAAIFEKAYGQEHPDYALALLNLGILEYRADRFDEAAEIWTQALGVYRKNSPDHPSVPKLLGNIAQARRRRGRFEEAAELQRQVIAVYRRLRPDHSGIPQAMTGLGESLLGLGRDAEATQHLEGALALYQKAGASNVDMAMTRFALARALWSTPAQRTRALELSQQARSAFVEARAKHGKTYDKNLAELDSWLAERSVSPK